MKKALGLVCAFALSLVLSSALAAEQPESLAATADRIALEMFELPPEDLTKAELALAFGWMHLFGMLGEPGPGRAVEYLEMAREDGLPEAGVILGAMYLGQGGVIGVPRDVPKAVEYYAEAAEKDCVDALRMLGIIYTEGEDGVEPDEEKALGYFVRAAVLGSETALEYLQPRFDEAALWEKNHPGEKADFPTSREAIIDTDLRDQAKERSNRISTVTARSLDLLAEAMTAEDAARLSAAASKALQQGEADIWSKLEQAVEQGVEMLITSQPTEAKQGDAALVVGIFHYMGLLNGYDPDRAREYLEIALEKGVPEAGVTLGELYLGLTRKGEAGEERGGDIEKGLSYLRAAAEKDSVDALRVLGFIYADGRDGVEMDADKAERYFRAAARHGDEQAIARLKANPDAGGIEIDTALADKAAARRKEIDQMIEQVNTELEQKILEAMGAGE